MAEKKDKGGAHEETRRVLSKIEEADKPALPPVPAAAPAEPKPPAAPVAAETPPEPVKLGYVDCPTCGQPAPVVEHHPRGAGAPLALCEKGHEARLGHSWKNAGKIRAKP